MKKLEKALDTMAKIAGLIAATYVIVDAAARVVITAKDIARNRRMKKEANAAAA